MSNQNPLGVSLDALPARSQKKIVTEKSTASEISAYAHDIRRSLIVGGVAIALELVLYFTNVLSRFG